MVISLWTNIHYQSLVFFLKRKTKSILVKCFTIFSSLYRTISYFRLYGYFFIKKTVPYGNDVRYGSDSVTVNYNVICFYFRKNIIFKHNIEDVQLFWLSNFLFKQKKNVLFYFDFNLGNFRFFFGVPFWISISTQTNSKRNSGF